MIGCADPVEGTCPPHQMTICASPDTPIATPDGERSMVSLRAGDLVYSLDAGAIRAVPLLRVQRAPALNHHVVHVELDSGVTLEISPSHPTADGRTFGDLHVGDRLDGHIILEARVIPYALDFTVDILPDSDTGSYYAGGARIGTTMRR